MKIGKEKKEFKDVYPTFESSIEFFKTTLKLDFNWENKTVLEKFKRIYEILLVDPFKYKHRHLKIYDLYGLQDRQCDSHVSLKERGFNDSDIEKHILEKRNKNKKNYDNAKNNLFNQEKITYHYSNYSFKDAPHLKCKFCGSELNTRIHNKTDLKIISCPNNECITNKKPHKRYVYFLPDNLVEEEYKRIQGRNYLSIEYYLKRGYDVEEAKKIISKIQKDFASRVKNYTKVNKEYIINKFGQEYAENMFKKRSRFCMEYWLEKGFSKEDAKKEINKLQTEYGNVNKEQIKKNPKAWRQKSVRCKEYWLEKGFSEKDAKEKLKEIQSVGSLKNFIKRYGMDEGLSKWKKRQEKWQNSLHKSKKLHVGYSNISQELFGKIAETYDKEEIDFLFYGSKNREYSLKTKNNFYIYDFCDLNKRKLIEFNGDIYHGNPEIFVATDRPNPFKQDKTWQDLWNYDAEKINEAKKQGFDVLTIWEKEYRSNPTETLNKCINFLNK